MKFNQPENPEILKCSIAYNELGAYCIPDSSNHEGAGEIVSRGVVYEGCTHKFIRDNCGSGDIVHAGTFFGDMIPSFSQVCKGTVWAFEPVRENYRCAKITMMLNGGCSNVRMTNSGLGSREDAVLIQTGRTSGKGLGGCARIMEIKEGCAHEMIRITTIDKVVPKDQNVSIMQLDVEGFEMEALQGGIETINASKPYLVLEAVVDKKYDPDSILRNEWFIENILSRGYKLADFDGVMGDKGHRAKIHGNLCFTHADRPAPVYF